jgi:ubiquinone/menaquinone biosynthesis C-methylase UbiE
MATTSDDMVLTKDEVTTIYRHRARRYDVSANLYRLVGFRLPAYRRLAVEALDLREGDTVVEIGCGTGLNLPLLQAVVGPQGKIVGVDLTDAMLAQAERRVRDAGWSNVELVRADASRYQFPRGVNGVISTLAITLVPEFDDIVRHGSEALADGGRFVVFDFKFPSKWYARPLVPLATFLTRPFGVRIEMASRHPWESIQKYFDRTTVREFYLGMSYIATGMGARGAAGRR